MLESDTSVLSCVIIQLGGYCLCWSQDPGASQEPASLPGLDCSASVIPPVRLQSGARTARWTGGTRLEGGLEVEVGRGGGALIRRKICST